MNPVRWIVAASVVGTAALAAVCVATDRQRPPDAPPASAAAGADPTPPSTSRIPRIDVHVHLSGGGEAELHALMERYEFDHVVNLSGGHPLRGLHDQVARARASGRVTVFTSLAYEQVERAGYGDRMAKLLQLGHELGARGLKIAKLLGLGLAGPDGKLLPVDDPGLDAVFDAAGQLGMPVAIHSGDPRAFWDAVDDHNERRDELTAHPGWSLHGYDVPSFDEILNQLDRRIGRHPKTTFISVHFGNCAEDPDRVARMLRKHPNLVIDTSARIPEMGRHDSEKMRGFFVEFQDRILFGSDLGVGPPGSALFLGSSGDRPPTAEERELFFGATRRYFETSDRAFAHPTPIQGRWKIDGVKLPRDVLEKVYWKNAARVLGIERPPLVPQPKSR